MIQIPEYMYTEPGTVGYESIDVQNDTYRFAISGVIPLSGETSILDIGAGRGDLYHYIRELLPTLKIHYAGYEQNDLLAKVGNEKISKVDWDRNLAKPWIHNQNFLDGIFKEDETWDHVFAIGTMNIDYGWTTGDWTHLELMITRAMTLAKYTVTFVMLHDNGGYDVYKSFPIPDVTDLVLKLNCSFKVDYDNETGIYKLTLTKI